MMIKIILVLFLISTWCSAEVVTNTYFDLDSKTSYKIEFGFNPEKYTVLNNIKHFPSDIIVSRLHGKEYYVIDASTGVYTRHQCWEDSILDIIRKVENTEYNLSYTH